MQKMIGGIFVLGAVLLGLSAADTFLFKVGSWHGAYTVLGLVTCTAEVIGVVACVQAARRYLAPVSADRDRSSVG